MSHGKTEEYSECIQKDIIEISLYEGEQPDAVHSFRMHTHVQCMCTVINERLSIHVKGRTVDAGRAGLRVPPLTMDLMEKSRP